MTQKKDKEFKKTPSPAQGDEREEFVNPEEEQDIDLVSSYEREEGGDEDEESAEPARKPRYKSPKFSRRIYLIKRGLQFRYMGVILTSMLLVSLVVGWTVYFTIWKDISDPTKTHDQLEQIFMEGNENLIYRLAVVMLMVCFLSVFVSHKIAGPVYRLEESAKIIASGDFSRRIKLRSGDELQELADAFNTMTDSLDKVVGEDKRMMQHLNTIIGKIKEDFTKKTIAEKRKDDIIKELTYIASELDRLSSTFVVTDDVEEA